MSTRDTDVRHRVITTAAIMLARYGLNATSIREMAKAAEAPLGSTYHHFPGGKHQVLCEAVKYAGDQVTATLKCCLREGAVAGLCGFLAMWREILIQADFRTGCPVLAAAVETPIGGGGENALEAANCAFRQWEDQLKNSLELYGYAPSSAAGFATLIVAAVEGSIALCRASRSIQPFDRVCEQLEQLLAET
ncbi:TetR/AcrR family transcriptional regulator [Citrobacter braakii]